MRTSKLFYIVIGSLIYSSTTQAQTPQMLAPGIISNDRVFGITLTPDEKTAYFVNSRGGRDTMTLATSTYHNGQWTKPMPVPFANNPGVWNDIDPILSSDGNVLVFNSNRPRPDGSSRKDFDIWAVQQTAKKGWGEPYHLGNVVNSDSSDFYASMATNGNLYFCSTRKGGFGGIDIYKSSLVNGVYQPPVNLGNTINSAGAETNVYVAPDERYIIFQKRSLTNEGVSGIVISFRQNDQWTAPQRLDAAINSNQGEFTPFVSPNGQTFYYSRLKRTKPLTENIYMIPFSADKYQPSAALPSTAHTDSTLLLATLHDYLDGGTQGDTTRLIRAFHSSASMKFIDTKTGAFRDVPIAEYLAGARKNYGRPLTRSTQIVDYSISGTAAQARVESEYATFTFIDYFNLLKMDDGWKIVSKIFYREDKK
ncbi:nuclear transport factor 2 family protein [Spirosoma sp. BT702]|uniref:Nuclear transport factor 2 family protein n=1 Tax=Spirosoma profusum TaxID=2771354 RepID=A0A927AWM6_9BACT|nr:nuclear transport factor 2 family protein [Spirosoma profusum]MBD2705828.1 nuclear transport factor 2 family protein [Spirosoma profusum]